jgi:hypothetical protein
LLSFGRSEHSPNARIGAGHHTKRTYDKQPGPSKRPGTEDVQQGPSKAPRIQKTENPPRGDRDERPGPSSSKAKPKRVRTKMTDEERAARKKVSRKASHDRNREQENARARDRYAIKAEEKRTAQDLANAQDREARRLARERAMPSAELARERAIGAARADFLKSKPPPPR